MLQALKGGPVPVKIVSVSYTHLDVYKRQALGRFEKSVGIYSNATPSLVYMKFTGAVVQEIKDYTKTHPFAIGNIRIDRDEFAFPDVYLSLIHI